MLSYLCQLGLQFVLYVGNFGDAPIKSQIAVRELPPQVFGGDFKRMVCFLAERGRVGPGILGIPDVVIAELCPCFGD